MKQIITSPNAPAALGPYSHAVQVGNFLFTSGQVPLVPETGKLAGESIEAQANQVLDNLEQVLKSAGLTFADVVKTTIFLTDLSDFAAVNAIPVSPPIPPHGPACRWQSCRQERRWRWS